MRPRLQLNVLIPTPQSCGVAGTVGASVRQAHPVRTLDVHITVISTGAPTGRAFCEAVFM
jgi:hypothetical protein